MRKKKWIPPLLIMALMLCREPVFSQDFTGWLNINKNRITEYEEGEQTSERDSLGTNLYLNLRNSVSPLFSYQLYLRANVSDEDVTDESVDISKNYRRSLEPSLELLFGTPYYGLALGYRRNEEWRSADLENEARETREFSYARFHLMPERLPSLHINIEELRNFDHAEERSVDTTDTSYSISSAYELPSRDVKARYVLNYEHSVDKTPLSIIEKTVGDNFNALYNIGYTDRYWYDRADYTLTYQGNYFRNRNRQFVSQTGAVLLDRTALKGLYAQDNDGILPIEQDVDELLPESALIDGFLNVSAGIGLSDLPPMAADPGDEFQNIGIQVSSQRPVDRLYIYVNRDISGDTILRNVSNWKVFKSNANLAGTWVPVAISSVAVDIDTDSSEFRFVIAFSLPERASYFKAVNLQVTNVPDIEVTEIAALGTDDADEEELTDVTRFFSQRLAASTRIRPSEKVHFTLSYSIDRADENPRSVIHSMGGIFENILSDSLDEDKRDFNSDVRRTYSAASTWYTHPLLTTIFRFLRNETFDNRHEIDTTSNTYDLSFSSVPLPTLDATLSLIRNETFSFGEKNSTVNSVLLSVGAELYRDVNMYTDLGYRESESFVNDSTTSTSFINGSLDAVLTRRTSMNLDYGFSWTTSDGSSSDSKGGSLTMTHRPSRFVNISGTLSAFDSDGNITTSEGLLIDWLPLPAVSLNVNYLHRDSEPGPIITDSLNSSAVWYITGFADIRFTFGYAKREEATETEQYTISTDLNCRF